MLDIKQESLKLKESCASCGKPINKGTITGWLVGSEYQSLYDRWGCTCASENQTKEVSESQTSADHRIGQWSIKSQLRSGYLGSVFLAENSAKNETVAIRIFNPILSQNKRIVKRFLQEAEKAKSLTHRNIAMVYDYGTLPDGRVYVVSEYVGGVSLKDLLKEEGFLDVHAALRIVEQICDALEEAHGEGILHRSIKPSKIMVQPSGSIKFIDFGLEKAIPAAGKVTQCLSQISGELGNPRYMSPEQCLGEGLDERSDLYSLGCIMYEMLTGKQIFAEHKGFLVALAQLREQPQPFSKVMYNSEIPRSVESVVMRLLEKSSEDRYLSAKQLREDVEALLNRKEPPFASKTPVKQKPVAEKHYQVKPRKQKQLVIGATVILASLFLLSSAFAVICYFLLTAPHDLGPGPRYTASPDSPPAPAPTSYVEPKTSRHRRAYTMYDSYYGNNNSQPKTFVRKMPADTGVYDSDYTPSNAKTKNFVKQDSSEPWEKWQKKQAESSDSDSNAWQKFSNPFEN